MLKKIAIIACCCLGPITVFAAGSYSDVPAGVWFEDAVTVMAKAGYLDTSKIFFHPEDNATRAEFIKLIVKLNGGVVHPTPAIGSFDDVPKNDWSFPYFEEAAQEHWVQGQGNCIGKNPCFAHPNDLITRAEAAVLIMRAFRLEKSGDPLPFVDVPAGQWYTDAFTTLNDICVMIGDDQTGRMRPFSNLSRAEMIVLLNRTVEHVQNGTMCDRLHGGTGNSISTVLWTGPQTVEVTFLHNVDDQALVDISRYALSEGSGSFTILSAKLLKPNNTVELRVKEAFGGCGSNDTLKVNQMSVTADEAFSDSMDFQGYCN